MYKDTKNEPKCVANVPVLTDFKDDFTGEAAVVTKTEVVEGNVVNILSL